MAQCVFAWLVKDAGLEHDFYIESAATSREEIGNPPHRGTVRKLQQEQIPVIPHRAVQMTRRDYANYDYLIGMDDWNIRNIRRIAGGDPEEKIFRMLEFAGDGWKEIAAGNRSGRARDVDDPWYTGDFDSAFDDILAGCRGLLSYLRQL